MKQSKFISVVIATLLLFCSADAFAQRFRGGGSGGRMEGSSRSENRVSQSSSSSCSKSRPKSSTNTVYVGRPRSGDYSSGAFNSYYTHLGGRYYTPIVSIARPAYNFDEKSSAIYFSKKEVLSAPCPNFGYQVSKRTATKGSVMIPHSTGDLYYRDGIFFSKCSDSRKYAIRKPSSGVHVPVLPITSSVYELNGTTYYYNYATYYTFDESTFDFVVVTPPVGLVVDNVPCDAKEIIVDDEHYYIVGNVLYKEVDSKYEVTKLDKDALHQIKDFLASAK